MRDEAKLYPAAYFQIHKYSQDHKRREMYRQERERIEKRITQGNILDVGCGLGGFLADFADNYWGKYGTEISPYAAQIAQGKGVTVKSYQESYDYPVRFFDVIVFRGTLQHLDQPFEVLQKCTTLLRSKGWLVFLATPNTNSTVYKRFGNLPALDPCRNWLLPSDRMLKQILTNLEFVNIEFEYPYIETPYAAPIRDAWRYLLRLLGLSDKPFAWPGNMMECYAQKR